MPPFQTDELTLVQVCYYIFVTKLDRQHITIQSSLGQAGVTLAGLVNKPPSQWMVPVYCDSHSVVRLQSDYIIYIHISSAQGSGGPVYTIRASCLHIHWCQL